MDKRSETGLDCRSLRVQTARCVLQRSVTIARASRLKQKQRQFCMFFNRFGRCKRGDACPYIHDPDKIAVCTRFLRGRCKEGDSCPFSHKVSKDKMPVCSFFLRGVCSNSDCPYSHVYVSRHAQVCEDFTRGYCPEGQKCKKKHTLVCPDPGCRQGNTCKLQHKQPIKSSSGRRTRPHSNRIKPSTPRTPDLTAAPSSSLVPSANRDVDSAATADCGGDLAADHCGALQKLPSFISLCNSSEEPDTPQTPGKTLQIKPRL